MHNYQNLNLLLSFEAQTPVWYTLNQLLEHGLWEYAGLSEYSIIATKEVTIKG